MQFPKPVICVSACLNGQNVRYNGQTVNDDFVSLLLKYCKPFNVCPEVSIGLGVPRNRILVYYANNQFRLFQPATQKDVTDLMQQFATSFLSTLQGVDGFILKAKSPSCGVSGTKIYKDTMGSIFHSKGKGLFATEVINKFGYLPIEDEGRLRDEDIRENFLIRIFTLARFREMLSNNVSIQKLIQFHQENKYIMMTYNQRKLSQLGRIVAGYKKGAFEKTLNDYKTVFYTAFTRKPSQKQHVNTILHIFGYFSDKLNSNEKKHFLHLLDQYREHKISRIVIIELLRNWAHRFNDTYLLSQQYLDPYPEELAVR